MAEWVRTEEQGIQPILCAPVNRSARVEGATKGGQVIVSGDTWEIIKDHLEELGNPETEFLGEFTLKGRSQKHFQ